MSEALTWLESDQLERVYAQEMARNRLRCYTPLLFLVTPSLTIPVATSTLINVEVLQLAT
jgi:hypothetical protein